MAKRTRTISESSKSAEVVFITDLGKGKKHSVTKHMRKSGNKLVAEDGTVLKQ